MKKSILFAAMGIMVLALSACNNTEEEIVEEPVNVEVVEEEPEEVVEETLEEVEVEDEGEEVVGMANPWTESSEEEAVADIPRSFKAPEGAENVVWTKMEDNGQTLYQLSFDLDDLSYTAREKVTPEEEDISGTYYEWTVDMDTTLDNWGEGNMAGKMYRYIGDDEWVDLCTWFDVEIGISYSLSTSSSDLDGFDISAVASSMYSE